jgi:WD40 repeat protein
LRSLTGRTAGATAVALTPDGRRAVSAGKVAVLRIWDVSTGWCLGVLPGHAGEVLGVSLTADGC